MSTDLYNVGWLHAHQTAPHIHETRADAHAYAERTAPADASNYARARWIRGYMTRVIGGADA